MNFNFKLIFKGLAYLFIILLVIISLVILYIILQSKGEITAFSDSQGRPLEKSLSEKVYVDINGKKQGMIIRGKDIEKPILLFIHGGPGIPEYFLNEYYKNALEDHFLVCWWEARGSSLSYVDNLKYDDVSIDILTSDTIEVTEYLKERFNKEKVYLMGHSFGSLIGVKASQKRPDLYYAYIAMAQFTGGELVGKRANTITYSHLKDIFIKSSDKRSLKSLEEVSIKEGEEVTFKKEALGRVDSLKHRAGCGTMHKMKSPITGIFFPHLFSRSYNLKEKINFWRGNFSLRNTKLFKEVLAIDLMEDDINFKIPVYFFSGIHDYTCPYPLSHDYYEKIKAPIKGFYTFYNSSHSPLWEENEKAMNILVNDVIKGKNTMKD